MTSRKRSISLSSFFQTSTTQLVCKIHFKFQNLCLKKRERNLSRIGITSAHLSTRPINGLIITRKSWLTLYHSRNFQQDVRVSEHAHTQSDMCHIIHNNKLSLCGPFLIWRSIVMASREEPLSDFIYLFPALKENLPPYLCSRGKLGTSKPTQVSNWNIYIYKISTSLSLLPKILPFILLFFFCGGETNPLLFNVV